MSNKAAVLHGNRRQWAQAANELAEAKRVATEAFAGIRREMKAGGFGKTDVAAVKLSVKRSSETPEQSAAREEAEAIAAVLAEFGE